MVGDKGAPLESTADKQSNQLIFKLGKSAQKIRYKLQSMRAWGAAGTSLRVASWLNSELVQKTAEKKSKRKK